MVAFAPTTPMVVVWLVLLMSPWRAACVLLRQDADAILEDQFSKTPSTLLRSGPQRLPVVLWHGMGDSCCASYSIGAIKARLESELETFVYSIAFGETVIADVWSGFFGDVNDQIAEVCAQMRGIPELQGGYNAIGFSQGGQFLRALIQRCQHTGPRANILITLGAQHQGVMNVPSCYTQPSNTSWTICEWMRSILSFGAYLPWVRDHVVQAQYYKDPQHLDQYVSNNPFLPDANNERLAKNPLYKENLASLSKLVLYRFGADQTGDSAWFSFYDGIRLIPLREQAIYQEDWIGLRELDESGRLELVDIPGAQHMHFSFKWFDEEIVQRYLM